MNEQPAAKRFRLTAAYVPTDANPETEAYGDPVELGVFPSERAAWRWFNRWPQRFWYPNPTITETAA